MLWFAQNSLPLRWQIQPTRKSLTERHGCDLLKIHYLCGDKYNNAFIPRWPRAVVICSKFITFAVTNTTFSRWKALNRLLWFAQNSLPLRWQIQLQSHTKQPKSGCDLLKIHYLCGDKYNNTQITRKRAWLWFAQNSLPLRWQIQQGSTASIKTSCCDLLKIHYLCGDKYNQDHWSLIMLQVVICSKFITFAVTNTTILGTPKVTISCDLLKIHYLCGDKYNVTFNNIVPVEVVICSKFITFAVTNTTL